MELTEREREVVREALRIAWVRTDNDPSDGWVTTLDGWDRAIARDLYFRFGEEAMVRRGA